MNLISGIPVVLHIKTDTQTRDPFGKKIFSDSSVTVENVLVSPIAADEVVTTVSLYGKKAVYELGIPKTDNHSWEDTEVEFFGRTWQTIGPETKGIDKLVPGAWNRKIKVTAYE